jgi:hypothetical protein
MSYLIEAPKWEKNQGRRILNDVRNMGAAPGCEIGVLAATLRRHHQLTIEWKLMNSSVARDLISEIVNAIGTKEFIRDATQPGMSCVSCLFAYGAPAGGSRRWLTEVLAEIKDLERKVEFFKSNPMPNEPDPHSARFPQ